MMQIQLVRCFQSGLSLSTEHRWDPCCRWVRYCLSDLCFRLDQSHRWDLCCQWVRYSRWVPSILLSRCFPLVRYSRWVPCCLSDRLPWTALQSDLCSLSDRYPQWVQYSPLDLYSRLGRCSLWDLLPSMQHPLDPYFQWAPSIPWDLSHRSMSIRPEFPADPCVRWDPSHRLHLSETLRREHLVPLCIQLGL